MRIGWLADRPGYIGGAELSAEAFRAAAPEGVEVIDCPPGDVERGLDTYVAHNVTQFSERDVAATTGRVTWYHHDLSPHVPEAVRIYLDCWATHIYCSPAQRRRYGSDGVCVPPPVDLERYRPTRQTRRHREGTCSIAAWQNPGKGGRALAEWAKDNGPVDLYGEGTYFPGASPGVNYCGALEPDEVAQTLWGYERFVFLPVAFEPFCRCVVEAWAAGCRVITNGLIGARHYIESEPEKLESAAEDFWQAVLA